VSVDQVGADIGTPAITINRIRPLMCPSIRLVPTSAPHTKTPDVDNCLVSVDQVGADIGTQCSVRNTSRRQCVRRSGWCRHRHL